jgi:hypothetical protein
LKVQRGTIIQLVVGDTPVGVATGEVPKPGTPIPGKVVAVLSIRIALDIVANSFLRPASSPVALEVVPRKPVLRAFPGVGKIIVRHSWRVQRYLEAVSEPGLSPSLALLVPIGSGARVRL